uniref:Uncharacterized protein n=1 Tax=Caenorhabditis tropicalis TaxID=1561998 RepID=A0A1I7UT43_9PELO
MKIPNCSDNLREGLKIHCERTSDSPACSHMTLYIIIACVGVVLLIGIIGGVWYYRRRRAAKRNGGSQSTTVSTETGSMATGGTTGTKGSTVKSTGRF